MDHMSDSSLEEISADDFRCKESRAKSRSRSRVLKRKMKCSSVSVSSGKEFSEFTNKSLGDGKTIVVYEIDDDEDLEEIVKDSESVTDSNGCVDKCVTDMEEDKEENGDVDMDKEENGDVDIGEFDRSVGLILEELEAVTVGEAKSNFEKVCSRLSKSFADLKHMRSQNSSLPVVDTLTQQALKGIKTVYGVYRSGKLKNMEQSREDLLRLLLDIKNQYAVFLTVEQLKEIDERVRLLTSESVLVDKPENVATSSGKVERVKLLAAESVIVDKSENVANLSGKAELLVLESVIVDKHEIVANLSDEADGVKSLSPENVNVNKPEIVHNSSGEADSESRAVNPVVSSNIGITLPQLEQPSTSRKVDFSPLLNLHGAYDEDSLPSPTRDNVCPLPRMKPVDIGNRMTSPPTWPISLKNLEARNESLHPNLADTVKELSSYQQKYGRNNIHDSSRLPSPTPSGDDNDCHNNSHNEVSSSTTGNNARNLGYSNIRPNSSSSSASHYVPVKPLGQSDSGPQTVTKTSAKSRDPRLNKFMKPVAGGGSQNGVFGSSMNSRKNKAADEPLPNGNTLKRQKSGPSRDLKVATKTGGVTHNDGLLASQAGSKVRFNENAAKETGKPENGVDANKKANGDLLASQMGSKVQPNDNAAMQTGKPENGVNANKKANGDLLASQMGSKVRPNDNAAMQTGKPENSANANKKPCLLASHMGSKIRPNENAAMESRKPENGMSANKKLKGSNIRSVPNPSARPGPAVSQPLPNEIAVNPTMLLEQVRREKQRLAEAQHEAAILKVVPEVQAKDVPVNPLEVGPKPILKPQLPPQSTSASAQNDAGTIRMKPRDPRRILHAKAVQKSLGTEQRETSGTLASNVHNKNHLTGRKQGEQAQTTSSQPQSTAPPVTVSTSTSTVAAPAELPSISLPIPNNISKPVIVSGKPGYGGIAGGSSQTGNPWGDVNHLLDGYNDEQKVAIQKERARRISEQNKMFSQRKLCLVLDLDHTLLNSAKFSEVDPIHEEILIKKEAEDREKPVRHLFRFHHMGMWTKLRPGVWRFLEKASKLFELHVYTMGNKAYASQIAKVLDPTGTLFAGRIISKGDECEPCDSDERVPRTKDLEGVLGMESAVVIIDDTVKVWPHHRLNLIAVERYTYFPCSRRQLGLSGPSLFEIDHDERPEDGTLASSLGVIERIHQIFFSHRSLNEVDVRNILASEQKKILSGCKIVFSRVFPVEEANPHLHPLWQTAERFGAVCTNKIDEQVTHVVANSLGTDKVNWARSTGKFVVHPGWVEASALLYRRANEREFAVKQ